MSRKFIFRSIATLIALAGILVVFELLTGFFYQTFEVEPGCRKAMKRRQSDILNDIVRNAASWYRIEQSHISVWISCPSRYDSLLTGIHEDGTVHYHLTYTNSAGHVHVVDSGMSSTLSHMIHLSRIERDPVFKPLNTYAFRIHKPDDFAGVVELSHCFRVVSLASIPVQSVVDTADMTDYTAEVFLKSQSSNSYEDMYGRHPIFSSRISIPQLSPP